MVGNGGRKPSPAIRTGDSRNSVAAVGRAAATDEALLAFGEEVNKGGCQVGALRTPVTVGKP